MNFLQSLKLISSSSRVALIALLALFLGSCGLGRLVKVDEHAYDGSYVDAKAIVTKLVDKCWTLMSENTLARDHYFGRIEEREREYSISIGRYSFDIPFTSFARIVVRDNSENVIIEVEEEKISLGTRYDVAKSVKKWLSGDTACRPFGS